jgi:hypothetical protein
MSGDKNHEECDPPFWKDISIIFKDFNLEYKPTCEHSVWNFVVRLLILSILVGMIGTVIGGLSALVVALMFGTLTAVVIIATTHPREDTRYEDNYHSLPYITNVDPSGYLAPLSGRMFGSGVEGFANGGYKQGSVQPNPTGVVEVDAFPYSGPMLPEYTPPTARNLFMNVLLEEIKYNPGRPQAAPVNNPEVKQTLDDYFRVQWFSDPTDVFGKNQSQRQFVTMPSTTVPNSQGDFANWLYKIPGKTCKEGGREACLAGTDGGPVTWLNMQS